jgi:hypothetical protein
MRNLNLPNVFDTKQPWGIIAMRYFAMPPTLANRLHKAFLAAHRRPEVAALLYALGRPWHTGDMLDAVNVLFIGPMRPARLMKILEQLVENRLLSRQEANEAEEHILERLDCRGAYVGVALPDEEPYERSA